MVEKSKSAPARYFGDYLTQSIIELADNAVELRRHFSERATDQPIDVDFCRVLLSEIRKAESVASAKLQCLERRFQEQLDRRSQPG
jgi:hypothetical protein